MGRFRRSLAATAMAAGLLAGAAATTARSQELNVALFGGSFAENVRTCVAEPFQRATGARVNFVLGNSVQNAARLRATRGRPDVDIAYMDLQVAVQAKNEGLLDQVDAARLTNLPDIYPSAVDPDRRWIGFMYSSTAIAYNPRELRNPPQAWADLWSPSLRGKLAIGDITATSGQHFLIAAARINGGSVENVEPGFRAIRDLRPHVVTLYTQADQVVQLIERGDIAAAVWFSDRVGAAARSGVPVAVVFPREGAVGILPTFSIPIGARSKALAEQYMDRALGAEAQRCFAERQFAGPTNRRVELPDELARLVPYRESVERMYFPPPEIVARSLPAWTERWNREIAR
ncbi:ABC transporter substrate-binding protein [Caldovatus sediminis]|uniref:ABC transporter substrate-binding protein n=1 Tax=Caldovatus sediminis TaxID=2041189 RepID=A0A8J3EE57_9PROT|nr:ABC transporter substrate-binding protein [Caldovatus sediminis]GGG49624.1 ABC transporter substrate-binding protein [Caldovatus sediminis]